MLLFFIFILLIIVISQFEIVNNFKESVIAITLIFSGFIVLVTELLSLFKSINLVCVAGVWGVFFITLLLGLFRNKKQTTKSLSEIKQKFLVFFKSQDKLGKILLTIVITEVLLLFYQGLIYPPNNWDSLTYHMSRITHWLSNGSVDHFPTHVLRQLYQPPFAEYVIMNVNLLNGNDYFSNSVQLFYLSLSIIGIWSILDYFEVSRFHKILSAFLLLTIPSVELQASTTKNDIVCGFFIIVSLYYCIKNFYETNLKNYFFLGLAIGLAIFTKGTAYLFLIPILIVFVGFQFYKLVKTKDLKLISFNTIVVLVVLTINVAHFSRNYGVNKNILTIDSVEGKLYNNENRTPTQFVSNLLKNFGLHIGFPFQKKYNTWIREFHKYNKINIDSPDSNWLQIAYQGPKEYETHEDYIPNTIHFFLIGFCSVFIIILGIMKPRKYKKEFLLTLIILLQLFVFVFYLKWQPWHTRLHIPIFMVSTLLIAVLLKKSRWFSIGVVLAVPLILYGFCFNFIYNNTRPIKTNFKYTKNINVDDSRFKKYFANQLYLEKEYKTIQNLINISQPKKVGLLISDWQYWEYPLFSDFYYEKINIICINVRNITSIIPQNNNNIDVIISTNPKTNSFDFEGKKYINQTPNNSYIWFYK